MGISLHTKAVPSGGTLEAGVTPNRGQAQGPGQAIDTRCDLSDSALTLARKGMYSKEPPRCLCASLSECLTFRMQLFYLYFNPPPSTQGCPLGLCSLAMGLFSSSRSFL